MCKISWRIILRITQMYTCVYGLTNKRICLLSETENGDKVLVCVTGAYV